MKDFTHQTYLSLICALRDAGYHLVSFADIRETGRESGQRHVVLRHDVDRLPGRALMLAQLESYEGVRATYFFRTHRSSFDPRIISQVRDLGHEIGYHYETLADARGDFALAWQLFRRELERFAPFGGVTSIAMHGRPFSPWDGRLLWEHYDYRELGIRLEAYRDIDWSRYLYFTDTGRRWDGAFNIRDHVSTDPAKGAQGARSTGQVAQLIASSGRDCVLSAHPERWTTSAAGWIQVWCADQAINLAKAMLRGPRSAQP